MDQSRPRVALSNPSFPTLRILDRGEKNEREINGNKKRRRKGARYEVLDDLGQSGSSSISERSLLPPPLPSSPSSPLAVRLTRRFPCLWIYRPSRGRRDIGRRARRFARRGPVSRANRSNGRHRSRDRHPRIPFKGYPL